MQSIVHRFAIGLILTAMLAIVPCVRAQAQQTFASPEDAAKALLDALASNDNARVLAIFGPDAGDVVSSGDPELDRHERELLLLAMKQSWHWAAGKAGRKELIIGDEAWPFAVPLVHSGAKWRFDVAAGKQEVLARRVGRNELKVIGVCRLYVLAQKAYAAEGRDGKPAGVYAQKVRSSPGLHDGLYWPAAKGETLSPLGDLAAQAAQDGYDREASGPSAPFYGYYFRIVTAQGRSAVGGAKSYVANGNMTGGFALIAYPATYRNSGVMTFVVNQTGVVYEKDLGSDTATAAGAITSYSPDKSWRISK